MAANPNVVDTNVSSAEYKALEEAFDIIADKLSAADTKIRQQEKMIELLKKCLLRRCRQLKVNP